MTEIEIKLGRCLVENMVLKNRIYRLEEDLDYANCELEKLKSRPFLEWTKLLPIWPRKEK